jgi:hypothetical protein
MSYAPGYIPGDRKTACDVCGFTYRRSEMRRGITGKQKGLIVCPEDFDDIHPNERRVKNRPEGKLMEIK